MGSAPRILVVDDEPDQADAMAETLSRVGYSVSVETSGEAALDALRAESFDIILTDLVLGEISGLDILREARKSVPDVEVVVISGRGGVESAVEAMQQGAASYLVKPLNIDSMRQIVRQHAEKQALARRNEELEKRLDVRFGFAGIIGKSPEMQRIFELLQQISPTNATVLIIGESGTGKELIAKAIHQNSRRKHGPFVAINCAALSEGVLESELFGHVKGAFTGALRSHEGKFEYASGGTLFLDEVGDMPLPLQAKLLRVIEEREIVRVGANQPIPIDVRLLAATNQHLRGLVEERKFREDLFFRLNVVAIELPPLRERTGDIPLLVHSAIREFSEVHGKRVSGLRPEVMNVLTSYGWPGNVRELRNTVESMVIVSRGEDLTVSDIPSAVARAAGGDAAALPAGEVLKIEDMERRLIEAALRDSGGNREQAAQKLGISERTLYRKIKSYEL
ncbi:MAG: sigma-54 dependent transcriptional regulator [Planctomycetes bacterium]|nr:sigma-54 dependent transcriptional regulator [Planctomycetota bacterium]